MEDLQRIMYITHIHEAAAKDKHINALLIKFYEQVCLEAKMRQIKLSVLFPLQDELNVVVDSKDITT